MPFDENAALEVTAVRAIESADRASAIWTDADRAWASRAAAELCGEGAAPEAFLAARARIALQRLSERSKPLSRAVRALRWRPWVSVAFVVLAFVAGVVIDQVGGSQRINLLAPPFFALLVWNVAVYVALAFGFLVRYGEPSHLGPLRSLLTRIAGGAAGQGRSDVAAVIAQFAAEWARLSAPLYVARAARIFHVAAAVFAVGLIAGLYVRGLAFEYKATWESTFLSAPTVRTVLAVMLSPGAALTGIPVPSLAEVEAIRAPASEIGALAALDGRDGGTDRDSAAAFACPGLRGARATPRDAPAARDQCPVLCAIAARIPRWSDVGARRALQLSVRLTRRPRSKASFARCSGQTLRSPSWHPLSTGGEDALAVNDSAANVIALFNATATPEDEAHGVLLDRLRTSLGPGGIVVALVDESALRERWGMSRRDSRSVAVSGVHCATIIT